MIKFGNRWKIIKFLFDPSPVSIYFSCLVVGDIFKLLGTIYDRSLNFALVPIPFDQLRHWSSFLFLTPKTNRRFAWRNFQIENGFSPKKALEFILKYSESSKKGYWLTLNFFIFKYLINNNNNNKSGSLGLCTRGWVDSIFQKNFQNVFCDEKLHIWVAMILRCFFYLKK